MADEATIRISLQINSGNLQYRSYPTDFTTDITGLKGPSPGAITVPILGVSVNFTELTTPGWCWIYNLDLTNFVTVGILDPDGSFHPMLEVLPGEFQLVRLSRSLTQTWGTGTATTTEVASALHMQANMAPCNVVVEAFET